MHLRPPSVDKGVQAFLWAFFFFLYLWLGMLAVDVSGANAFIFAAIVAGAIFLYIRIYGEDEPSRRGPPARIR
jgi:sugar phosphate permease